MQARRFLSVVLVCTSLGVGSLWGQGQRQKPLHEAAGTGDIDQLQGHIARGANLNALDQFGATPLLAAIEAAQTEAAKVLIEGGADVDGKDRSGRTPLMRAAVKGQLEIVSVLLAKGANKEAKDASGRTPLVMAVLFGHLPVVEALVKAGADVNGSGGAQAPLVAARQRGRADIEAFLKDNGAQEPQGQGDSPYGDYEQNYRQGGGAEAAPPSVLGGPTEIVIDPNEIKKMIAQIEELGAALAAIDANSAYESRGWLQRRADNRTSMIRAISKQFADELSFVKGIAVSEKAGKTVEAVDALSAKRERRYEALNDALRDQRREEMLQSRQSGTGGRGGYGTGRGGYGGARGGSAGGYGSRGGRSGRGGSTAYGSDPYGEPGGRPAPRSTRQEPNEPPLDADTEAQIQAWLNARPEDKSSLLASCHELDIAELSIVMVAAEEEEAPKTQAAIMGLMMLRGQRSEMITLKWAEEDERTRRLEERYGAQGQQSTRSRRTR